MQHLPHHQQRKVLVRFQASEIIQFQDTEIVLRALETCLRDLAGEVVRSGPEIILHGLGPSPRAVNLRDITILRVEAEENGTVINADVSFQASAFLGDTPQDAVVRSKLDRVFDQMKMRLAHEKKRAALYPPVIEIAPVSALAAIEAPSPEVHIEVPVAPMLTHSLAATSVQTPEPALHPPASPIAPELIPQELGSQKLSSQELAPQKLQQNFADLQSVPASPNSVLPLPASGASLLDRLRQRPAPVLAAILLLLAPGIFLVWRHTPHASPQPVTPRPVSPAQNVAALRPVPPPSTSHLSPALTATLSVADPNLWVKNWVAAMGTRDADTQAAFYADTVDRYFDERNLSNAQVLQKKRAAIQSSQGLWTVKYEKITLSRQTEDAVTVNLVKHYVAQTEPAQISEQLFESRLQLKRFNGIWKITSEQDLILSKDTPPLPPVEPLTT